MAQHDGVLNFLTKIDSSGFKKGLDGIGGIAKAGIGLTTKVLQGATAGVTALGAAAVKVGSDFEAGMSQVQAISGASGEDLEKLKNKAKEMGASTKFSATESAEALNYMAMAGWKTEDMLDGIEGIMNLAAASGEDLATTSDIVTDALTAFGMKAGDATHFADILAAASSNANTNVSMMGETFKYVAPLAGSLGYSAEDTATAIGLMANAGIKGSQAGTALRSIMTRLAKPTKESQEAMDALGLSITDVLTGKMKPLSEITDDMRKGFAGLTEDEKATYAAMLGGQEAMSGLLAIVNASDADFEKLSGAINDCNGSAAEMAEIMQDNLQGQITILQSGLEGLGVSLYEAMQGTAKDVVKEAQGMVQQLQDAFNAGGLDGLVSAVGGVLAQIIERLAGAAPELVNMAVSLVGSLCEGLKSAPGIGDSAASLITSLVTGLASCVDDIWTTAIVLVGKMAEGVAAGAPQMVQAISTTVTDILECLVDWGPDLLQAGVDILLALVDGIVSAIPTLISQASMLLLEICEALRANLPALTQAAIDIVTALITGLVESAPLLFESALELLMALIEAIPVIIEQLLQALPDIITAIINYFTDNTPMIVNGAIQLLMGIIEAIPAIVVAIAENLPEILNAFTVGMIQGIPTIFNAAKDLLMGIVSAIPEIAESVSGAMPDILNGIVNGLISGIGAVKDAALELGSGILNSIKSFFGINSPSTVMTEQGDYLVQGLINGITGMPTELAQYLDETVQKIMAWGQQMLDAAQTAINGMVVMIIEIMAGLPGKIWEWLVNVITRMVAWKQQMLSTAKTAISNMISAIISQLMQLPGKVAGELAKVTAGMVQWGADIVSRMTEVGKNIVSGIWNGISSGWDWLNGKVADLANSLLDSAKNALGINSPSTKFRDKVGKWIMPGVAQGVENSMPKTLRGMKAEAGKLIAAMQGTVDAAMNNFTLAAAGGAGLKAATAGATFVEIDNSQSQENNYHVAVPTPSEVAKNQREAFRNFQKGVK